MKISESVFKKMINANHNIEFRRGTSHLNLVNFLVSLKIVIDLSPFVFINKTINDSMH